MSDETINASSLDFKVDEKIPHTPVREERYKDNVAGKHFSTTPKSNDDRRSWTMSEIEKTISDEVLNIKAKKLAQFGVGIQRKNDFRLPDLTRRLGSQINQDFAKEITKGPLENRVRQFDVQSQTMRMISANAALGSYQFQKMQVLPFMRKSLALDYEKVNLLKKVVGGIGSLEQSLLVKLEAIKMNTAAVVPKKLGYFGSIMKEVKEQNIKRIAGNISNLIMSRYDEQYKKHVAPIFQRLHQIMKDPSDRGGINGVSRAITQKLNGARRTTRKMAASDETKQGPFGAMQSVAARAASAVLGGAVRLGQGTRVPTKLNRFASDHLQSYTSFLDRLHPFAPISPQAAANGVFNNGLPEKLPSPLGSPSSTARLVNLLSDWRKESKAAHAHLLDNVIALRQKLAPTKVLGPIRTLKLPKLAKDQTKTPVEKPNALKAMFGSVGTRLNQINLSIRGENKAFKLFEKAQEKRQMMMDKLSAKVKIRKNSYEDIENSRKQIKGVFPWSKAAATAAAAAGIEHDAAGSMNPAGWFPNLTEMVTGLVGGLFTKGLKLGGKGAKLVAKTGFKATRKAVPFVARTGLKGLKGLFGLAGKSGFGALKLGGRGLFKFGTSGFGIGLAAGIGKHLFDKSGVTGATKRSGDTAFDAASYGAVGAEVGSLFGGVGAIPGALIGAAVGTVAANSDYAAKALHFMGKRVSAASNGLWTRIFGQKAIVNYDGSVKQQEKLSIIGELKSIFFGKKAKYSPTGELIAPEHLSLVGSVKYGFQKLLFGDKFDNGEYKQGTSIVAMMRDGISNTLKSFGAEMMALSGQIKRGAISLADKVGKAAKWTKDKAAQGVTATGNYIADKATKTKIALQKAGTKASDLYNNFSWKKVGEIINPASQGDYFMSPAGFAIGVSNAVFGWSIESGAIDNPASPYYNFVSEVLNAYGIKNRAMYKFIHSLELSQDKVNNRQINPFDDNDLAYMAGRFGFDSKNKDAVNYFKLWYKRRFMPAMAIIGKVLKAHKLTFGSALSATEKEIILTTGDLKKELASAGITTIGLEPTPQAYNKYAKIGAADPGGASPSTQNKTTPFDPRDPRNREQSLLNKLRSSRLNGGSDYDNQNSINGSYYGQQKAERKNAAMTKGKVKDQPEFKAAYQKLPPKLKRVVDKSKALQFVLWSTSIQHGADTASKIFQRDYSDQLNEKGYIRSIYQDRSTRFSDVSSDDRSEAVARLSEQERFADGIVDGTSSGDRATYASMVNNVVDPSGNSNLGYDLSSITPARVTGDAASRAKDAISYLMNSKRYTKVAAVAIAANLLGESGLRTNSVGDSGRAHGIAQWHPDRRAKIYQKFRKPVESMNLHEQLDAVDWEIKSGSGVTGGKNLAGDLNASSDVGSAVSKMVNRYERPADRQGETFKRTRTALGLMKTIGSDTGPAPAKQTKPAAQAAPASAQPTAKSVPSRTASKPTRASAPKEAPQRDPHAEAMGMHADGLKAHTEALNRNTAAMNKNTQRPAQKTVQHTSVVAPIIHAAQDAGNFISMSMKRVQAATGT